MTNKEILEAQKQLFTAANIISDQSLDISLNGSEQIADELDATNSSLLGTIQKLKTLIK